MSFGLGFIHKKDINKATVFTKSGYKGTLIYESDYEYIIKDNYAAKVGELIYKAGVRYKGDKDEVTWEQLEARRLYFRRFVELTIATAKVYDIKK